MANRVLAALKHTILALDKTAFLNLYKSLIRPHLEYASVIWNPALKRDKDTLEQVQRRATRLVQGLSHLSYSGRLASLQLPTLQFRRLRADVIQTFKILKNIDNINYSRECPECGKAMFQPVTINHKHSSSLWLSPYQPPKLLQPDFPANFEDN
ncbi:hypothetical protein Pcinc_042426 [Petrolisthes cinctipes]|uniref:RNA-directed DNA polymerase from mobile element jockey n=1 Tax=Petrolisthes cinctipes TaxID=88211 RepID=A0AAE1BI09_PETCI|nr:hypothetical protein Pcinc_042426 [Petrolisthes cinctipes]